MRTLLIAFAGSFLVVACGHSVFVAPEITRTDLTCPSSTTLELLVTRIRAQMPQSGSKLLRRANVNSASGLADNCQSDAARIV